MLKTKPDLSFWKLFNISFGFFGVQIAYALQSSQVSRIFSTIGADPHNLSYFWILPPLMGLLVQPIVGSASDKTWTRFGRRLPYLIVGAAVAIIVMCFLPNAGSLGFTVSSAIIFGLLMLMLLDTSINMAMQPFKMLVGDMVNEKQKGLAYSIQSFLCNAGSVVGYVTPFVLAWFLSSEAPEGKVPPTVTFAFYLGAAILLLCVIYTMVKVKEMPPVEYRMYQGTIDANEEKVGMFKLLKNAPKVFWTVGLVQFFCWAAFLYMWSYSTDAVAAQAFETPSKLSYVGVSIDGKNYNDKYVFLGETPIIEEGNLKVNKGSSVIVDGSELTIAHIMGKENGKVVFEQSKTVKVKDSSSLKYNTATVLDASSKNYQSAGDWNGVLLAIQGLVATLWALALPRFRNRKMAYTVSLILGAVGFISIYFIHNQYVLILSYGIVGCAWAAMLALPFTILTNALSGSHIGTYLGLFNCSICLPQILAAICGGTILGMFPVIGEGVSIGAPQSVLMLVTSGVLLLVGAVAVWLVKETSGENNQV